MPRVDGGVSGKGENFISDAGEEKIAVTPGKVPATDAIGKKDIPAKELVGAGEIEAETSRAVAGYEQEFSIGPAGWDGAGLWQELGGTDGAKPLRKTEGEHGVGLEAEKSGIWVVVDGAAGPFGEVGSIPDVIPVTVGEKKGIWLELFFLQKVEEALGSINRQTVAMEINHIGVRSGESTAVAQRFGHGSL